ncbi:GatB/YqeY domain-containing protein [Verrucomicrobiota bacterium sgz303538]
MDFQARIDNDLKEAMKAREADRLAVLRMLKTALKNASIEQGGADARLDDVAAMAVVRKEMKKRQDAVEGFEKGGRPELAAKERLEAEILQGYLPQPLTPEELQKLVADCIAEVGATSKAQMGAVMKLATERAAGRADGKALSAAVAAQLK